jgi:hypothetical protein
MITDKDRPIHKLNLKKELKNKKAGIVKDILKSQDDIKTGSYNFEVFSKHNNYLYDLFIKKSRKLLNPFTIRDSWLRVWCYFTGVGYHRKDRWHNHSHTSSINSVIYLETVKNHGIKFKNGKEPWYVEPNEFDLLIFPGFLNHLPVTSSTQKRISLNLELKCKEQDKDIFGL